MSEYNGWKLFDKVILVGRELHSKSDKKYMQAYLVDPKDKKQLESARYWARWTEYGSSYINDEGKRVHEYEIEHKPVEITLDNEGFEFELLECAGGSSQGGKLSFWNCLISKGEYTFKVGIAADLLLDLLKENDFVKGKCTDKVLFARQSGKVGVLTKNSNSYNEALKDEELKKMMSKKTTKYNIGDNVLTTTLNQIYMGTVYRYYVLKEDPNGYSHRMLDQVYTLTKLKEPIVKHVFLQFDDEEEFIKDNVIDVPKALCKRFWWGELSNNKTARTVNGKNYKLSCDVQKAFYDTFSSLEAAKNYHLYYAAPQGSDISMLKVLGLCRDHYFGYSPDDKPFDLDPHILSELKKLKHITFVGFEEE